jgi:DNA-directed RNA polymerase specialized sigma24 family protein
MQQEWLAERFEEERRHLFGVAYRMLGSTSEAEDAVQDAWLRLSRSDADEIDNIGGWLTTVVARVSLNMLRSRKTRGELPLEDRLPEPTIVLDDATTQAPRRARPALPGRAAGLRTPRSLRRALRRDRDDARPFLRLDAAAREPRAPKSQRAYA